MDAGGPERDDRDRRQEDEERTASARMVTNASSALSSLGQIFFPSFNVGSKTDRSGAKPGERGGKAEKRGSGKKSRVARPAKRSLEQ